MKAWLAVACAVVGAGCAGNSDHRISPSATDSVAKPADAGSTRGGDAGNSDTNRRKAISYCEGQTRALYDPVASAGTDVLPDDFWTVDDPASVTGVRVRFDASKHAWIDKTPPSFRHFYDDLGRLDGWGVTAGIVLRFSAAPGALPSGATSTSSEAVQLLDLGGSKPERVPFEVQLTDAGRTAILWPMRPLRPATHHAVFVTRKHLAADGTCISPSLALRSVLDGSAPDARLQRMVPRLQQARTAAGLEAGDVSAASVFTTQSTTAPAEAIAADILGRLHPWALPLTCTETAYADNDGKPQTLRTCSTAFAGHDYRKEGAIGSGAPAKQWSMPVAVWLPAQGKGPFPVVVFGHGLGSDRWQGKALAEVAAPQGIATVAIDAVQHGTHPAGGNKGTLNSVIGFFAISVATASVDAIRLRDNFRQSSFDGLQLLDALADQPDADGDGIAEFDVAKISYVGVSLGGIMGPALLALTPRIRAAVLPVAGARVGSIISDSVQFAPIIAALQPDGTEPGDVDRFFPMLQTLLDAGDPAAYAARIRAGRADGSVPHVLQTMAIDDEIVPNSCNRALARALGLQLVAPAWQPLGLGPPAVAAPMQGNGPGGATLALFQYDRVTKQPGAAPQKAEHGNVPGSREGLHQALHFLQTWLATGKAVVEDPYAALATPAMTGK
ncbi:MAG: hypothetical protein EXR79_12710 [Myxococcales bacterium]|nr:hypothetical protein [Myxococcales bacterium]